MSPVTDCNLSMTNSTNILLLQVHLTYFFRITNFPFDPTVVDSAHKLEDVALKVMNYYDNQHFNSDGLFSVDIVNYVCFKENQKEKEEKQSDWSYT